jgi:hypothetical protein
MIDDNITHPVKNKDASVVYGGISVAPGSHGRGIIADCTGSPGQPRLDRGKKKPGVTR